MSTKPLQGQMKALKSATDEAPKMGLYDINTPQSVREGTPLRLFSPERARYSQGDVVDDKKAYSQALAVYNTMVRAGADDGAIRASIGDAMMNKIKMNKANVTKAATGGLMGGDPRLGQSYEDVGYQAYSTGGLTDYELVQLKNMNYDVKKNGVSHYGGVKILKDVLKVNKYAEGGEVEGDMNIPELTPEQETSLDMQMEEALPPMEETEQDFDTVLDTSMLDEEEKVLLNEAVEMHPELETIIPKIVATEFTGEGEVDGPGTGTSDSIPAMLSDGEFVFTAKATKQIGVDKLRKQMKSAEEEYDNSMAVQDSQQMDSEQPMMYKGGLMSADKYKI